MRRFGSRRKKPRVRWLQDREFSGVQSISTSVGVLPTTTLVWDNDIDQDEFDPAQAEAQAGALGGATIAFLTPQQELREDKGWRLMRCVGDFNIGVKQTSTPVEGAGRAIYIKITVGLCVLDVDDEGNFLNEREWRLGENILPSDNFSTADAMRGEGASWIWRRNWFLQNYAANYGSGASNCMYAGWQPMNVGNLAAGGNHDFYSMFPASNNQYSSVSLGAHFDIKRHVTLKHNQQLAWRIWGCDMLQPAASSFEILLNRSYRSLIARAGKPFRGSKR